MQTSILWWKSFCFSIAITVCGMKMVLMFREMSRHCDLAITISSLQVGGFLALHSRAVDINRFLFGQQVPFLRTILNSRTRMTAFRDAVRGRDRRWVITGQRAHRADYYIWRDFEVAHFFPLAYEGHWMEHNYDRWITIPPATESAGSINSVQNGMLLREDIHTLLTAMMSLLI